MKYISTRDKNVSVTGAEAIARGISAEGGLFVPEGFPEIGKAELAEFCALSYSMRAAFICALFLPELNQEPRKELGIRNEELGIADSNQLASCNMHNANISAIPHSSFLTPNSPSDIHHPQHPVALRHPSYKEGNSLKESCEKAYALFEDDDPAPLVKLDEGMYMLELWHGPTHAFKDIALTLLPYLLIGSKRVLGDNSETLILVATSGDTGKAALEGFKDVPGTRVVVLFPDDGVSSLQKLQMQTSAGENVKVFGIKGNFDDAQTAVKAIFADGSAADALKQYGVALSSANSINFGRLLPQIVYYFSAYADLVNGNQIKPGKKINFCVPTGNFGNILAGYYAYRMGLPVNKLICASNRNNVLTDFIRDGAYCANRAFYRTASPSMDILISSNLERLVFELSSRDDRKTAERMAALKKDGKYDITESELADLNHVFWGGYADEDACGNALDDTFEEYGYIADPHTAVALAVYAEYLAASGDAETKTVILSTASPYKFVNDVLKAIGEEISSSERKNLARLEELTALPVPDALNELFSLEKLHTAVIEKHEARAAVLDYIKGLKQKP